MSTKARMILSAMTDAEVGAQVAELSALIDDAAGKLYSWRMKRRGLLISLANRERMRKDPSAFLRMRARLAQANACRATAKEVRDGRPTLT